MNFTSIKSAVIDYLARTDITTSQQANLINMAIRHLERGAWVFPDGRIVRHNWKHMQVKKEISLAADDYLIACPIPRYRGITDLFALDASSNIHEIDFVPYGFAMVNDPDLTNDKGAPKRITESNISDALTLSRGATDTQVANSAFDYELGNNVLSKVAASTALAAGTVPSGKWGLWLFSIDIAGTITCTAAAANATGYADEATALAAMPSVPTNNTGIGYVTVLGKSGQSFIPGTDGLKGGSSGNVARETNYYVIDKTPIRKWLIRPTCDIAYTLHVGGIQTSPDLDGLAYTTNWWTENAWDVLILFACLEAAPYLINDQRIAVWKDLAFTKLWSLVQGEDDYVANDLPLNIKTAEVLG